MMPGSQGNLSVRDPVRGVIAITPHDQPYATMEVEDLVILDANGSSVAGGAHPSSDLPTHVTVYRERPDVHAVIHTEPPFVNALAAVGQEILPITTTGLKSAGGSVPVMAFAPIRDVEFAQEMLTLLHGRHAVVWKNHGLLTVGSSLHQALERAYGVEANAEVLFHALQLGHPDVLDSEDANTVIA
jgi:L-ribulose-5-phosphate 4-epimerase